MRWVLNIVGIILAAVGVVWILQGLNVLKGGLMGGHIQYAFLGLVAVIVGLTLLAYAKRRHTAVS